MKQFFVLMLLVSGVTLVFAEKPQAFIREMTGTVELKAPGSERWVTAKQGDRIQESTIISTGFKSTAMLSVGNSTLLVRALTRMSLEALMNQDKTDTIDIGLTTGRVRVDVKPPAGTKTDFSIKSPTATASVRGTVFEFGTETLRVIEGKVGFQSAGDLTQHPVMVSAGQQARVDPDTGQIVVPLDAAELYLPALPGRKAAKGSHNRVRPSHGNLQVEVTFNEPKGVEE
jgi:hypothetical protein